MPLDKFIPEIWSARLLSNLNKALVYAQAGVVNRDYEGEISGAGDTVRINSIGRVTIGDYVKNANITDPEVLTDAQRALVIDQQKFFNFQVDDVDRAQQKPKVMDEAMKEAAYALRDVVDTSLAAVMVAGVDDSNLVGTTATPKEVTAANAYNFLVDLRTKLTQANVPMEGRFAIVPAWYTGLMLQDNRFVMSGIPQGENRLQNGEIARAAGFTIFESNNVPETTGTKYKIVAGHPSATSFAEQIISVEAYRPEKRFSDAVKGLHVYGRKVIRPKCLAVLTANIA